MANANRLDAPASAFFVVSFCMDCPLQAPAIDRSFAISGDPAQASHFCLDLIHVTGTTMWRDSSEHLPEAPISKQVSVVSFLLSGGRGRESRRDGVPHRLTFAGFIV